MEVINETLVPAVSSLLQLVLIIGVPVLFAFLGKAFKDWVSKYAEKTNNEYVANMMNDIATTVSNSVNMVSQTYVNELKRSDKFDVEQQKAAFQQSMDTAKTLLNDEAKALIEKTHGDVDLWLKVQIENVVKDNNLASALTPKVTE